MSNTRIMAGYKVCRKCRFQKPLEELIEVQEGNDKSTRYKCKEDCKSRRTNNRTKALIDKIVMAEEAPDHWEYLYAKQERMIQNLRDGNNLLRRELRQTRRELISWETIDSDREEFNPDPSLFRFDDKPRSDAREASIGVVLSDWHIGKIIDRDQVLGLNEFNYDIAVERVKNLGEAISSVTKIHQNGVDIDGIHLFCIGDLVQGYLRQTDWINCEFTPPEQVARCTELLINLIDELINALNLPIHVVVQGGNHGRLTGMAKVPSSDRVALSYETLLGENLKMAYRNSYGVAVTIPQAYHHLTNIQGKKILSSHGDDIKISNSTLAKGEIGVAPLMLAHYENLRKNIPHDCAIAGHWHNFSNFSNKLLINNCLCGLDTYALKLGYSALQPSQTLFMVDSKYGVNSTWELKL